MSGTPKRQRGASSTKRPAEIVAVDEGLFATAFHNSPAMQSVVRASDSVLVEVNDTFLKKLGFSREEVIGKTAFQLNFWVEPEKLAGVIEQLQAKGFLQGDEVRLRASNGDILTVLLSTHPVDIGGVRHFLSAGVDITARNEAEAKLLERERQLRESEARFSAAFQSSPAIQSIVRFPEAVLVEINDRFSKVLGYTREEVIGKTPFELNFWVSPEKLSAYRDLLERNRMVRDFEVEVRAKDGTIRTALLSSDVVEIGGALHSLTTAIDITEQKKAEQALRESEARTRSLYESISAAVAVHDESGFFQINSASLKLFGTDRPDEILGKQPSHFSAARQPDGEDSAIAAQRHMQRALANGVERFEWLGKKIDGTEFPVEVTLTALQLEGRPVLQAVIIDLTERKRAEAELQNALARERELSQLKSDFVSLVSHEFRTPLEIIMSSADNLDRYHDRLPAEKRRELLRTINKSVRRMSTMMEEVLVLGRLETDRMTFNPAAFDLKVFCRRVCDEIESATGRRCPINLRVTETQQAFGDESILRHIFTNLLSNAVKYSQADQQVDFIVERNGVHAVCQIVDRGCGIPEADQKRLFEAFHRGSNVRQIPGTGLGLLIVQRCVGLHGGGIHFESAEGKGTIFTLRLPLFTQTLSTHEKNPRN